MNTIPKPKSELCRLPIELVIANPRQPRQHFDADKLKELAQAIRSTGGLLQPIVVRKIDGGEPTAHSRYEIIAGERRWRACQLAGLDTIDCLIRPCTDEEMLEASIIENISRSDLNPIEEAKAYQRMIDEFGYVHDEVAAVLGKPRSNISNSLRLLNLDTKIQDWLIDDLLSAGHGKLLAVLPTELQRTLAQTCINKGWSVRQLEHAIKKLSRSDQGQQKLLDPNLQVLENKLGDHMGCQVKIAFDKHKGQGHLMINFHSLDAFSGLLKKLGIQI